MSLRSLGALIRSQCLAKRLSQRTLATSLGVTHTFLQLAIAGETTFHLKPEMAARIRASLAIDQALWASESAGLVPLHSGRPERNGNDAYKRTVAELKENRQCRRQKTPPPTPPSSADTGTPETST